MEALLLRQTYLLRMETGQVRHLSLKGCQVNKRINLIGQQDRLLLVNTLFVGTYTDKEVVTRNGTTGLTHLMAVIVLMHLRGSTRIGCLSGNGYLHRTGSYLLTAGMHVGSRNRIGTVLVCAENERIGDG